MFIFSPSLRWCLSLVIWSTYINCHIKPENLLVLTKKMIDPTIQQDIFQFQLLFPSSLNLNQHLFQSQRWPKLDCSQYIKQWMIIFVLYNHPSLPLQLNHTTLETCTLTAILQAEHISCSRFAKRHGVSFILIIDLSWNWFKNI